MFNNTVDEIIADFDKKIKKLHTLVTRKKEDNTILDNAILEATNRQWTNNEEIKRAERVISKIEEIIS